MSKHFLLAVLAAATLSLGFTACSDDDANIAENYSETYTMHFSENSNDAEEEEIESILSAYYEVLGLGDSSEEESITVTGADSASCVKKFLDLMATAESSLASKTWSTAYSVTGSDSHHTRVYDKTYGAYADNDVDVYVVDAFGTTNTYKYVKELDVDEFGNYFTAHYYFTTHYCSDDLNRDAGGDYVYMAAEGTNNINEAVTGAFVLSSEFGDPVESLTYHGIVYNLASHTDLNRKAGGSYLYLYTTRDKATNEALRYDGLRTCFAGHNPTNGYSSYIPMTLTNAEGKYDVVGDRAEFLPGTPCYTDRSQLDNITLRYRDDVLDYTQGLDLNEKAGGAYIYVIAQWETF